MQYFVCLQVAVLDVINLSFGKTRLEAEVGKDLVLNIQLYGVTKVWLILRLLSLVLVFLSPRYRAVRLI